MNYKFHVGDYVGFTDGNGKHTGHVISYYNYPIRNVHSFTFEFDDGTRFGWRGNIDDLPRNITRIGAYDFTKKEKKKIEHLEENLPIEGRLKDKTVELKQYLGDGYATFIYNGKMINKINELVDAVNKLRDKEDSE